MKMCQCNLTLVLGTKFHYANWKSRSFQKLQVLVAHSAAIQVLNNQLKPLQSESSLHTDFDILKTKNNV